MDRSVLAARIQDILKGRTTPSRPESAPPVEAPPRPCDEGAAFAARCAADEAASAARDLLGGEVLEGPGGRCLVVDRQYDAAHLHGRRPVGGYASAAAAAAHVLPSFLSAGAARRDAAAGGADDAAPRRTEPARMPRLLFFDLETTGLSGGAGTYAFLVGCGSFDGEAFTTRQFFLRGFGEERALLDAVRGFVEDAQGEDQRCLVTYNGRSFDLPLIETRYLFHRRTSPFASLPHVDMLFSARRLWRRRASVPEHLAPCAPGDLRASCALTALEQDILGLQREDDVPGWEIPARYFTYARTGDARGLTAVLEHNRLDLLSLAALTSVILEMVLEHEKADGGREQCLSLARLLDYLGRGRDAERCYERAAAPDGLAEGDFDRSARIEALHWLALHRRRARRFADAAEAWRGLLQVPSLDPELRREACEALAIHHEHRVKDLDAARAFALRALDVARGGRHVPEVEHRLGRLQRKLTGRTPLDPGTAAPLQRSLPGES